MRLKNYFHTLRNEFDESDGGANLSNQSSSVKDTPPLVKRTDVLTFDERGKPVGHDSPQAKQPKAAGTNQQATPRTNNNEVITIGGKQFTNPKDAWAYAEQLEQENNSLNAYTQGLRDGGLSRGQAAQTEPVEEPLLTEDEYYVDPVKAVQKVAQKVEERVTNQIKYEQTRQEKVTKFWNDFYSAHEDLAGLSDFCQYTLTQNMQQFENMKDFKLAHDKLANLVRSKLNMNKNNSSSTTRLPNTDHDASAGYTNSNSSVRNTSNNDDSQDSTYGDDDDELDFANQIKQHQNNKRRLNYGE